MENMGMRKKGFGSICDCSLRCGYSFAVGHRAFWTTVWVLLGYAAPPGVFGLKRFRR